MSTAKICKQNKKQKYLQDQVESRHTEDKALSTGMTVCREADSQRMFHCCCLLMTENKTYSLTSNYSTRLTPFGSYHAPKLSQAGVKYTGVGGKILQILLFISKMVGDRPIVIMEQ